MSVTTRIQELNNRLATNLVSKGVSAEGTETTTELINKVNDIESGGTSVINPEWTDWQYFSYNNSRNDLVAKLKYSDTSKGIRFASMFQGCSSLTTIPQLDTSNGTSFSSMFNSCSALTTIPQLDTSKGTNFGYMFNYCSKLTNIPQLDTSNGTSFSSMFVNCTDLTNIPQLDTSNGTDFNYMFRGCSKLTTIPQLDTSKGANFGYMFNSCSALTTIPQLDTSNGTSFIHMFYNCTDLTNLTMTGTIKANGMDLHYSTKLSKASIISVINALSDTTNALKIQFSKTAVNNAFETSSGVADGSTSEEWTTLIATKANWTIALS